MTFLQPAWLWLLPVVVPLILLMHARRRRDVVVASLVVWRRVQQAGGVVPSRRKFPWREPSLWLQLLTATILILALARPAVGGETGVRWVVLIDSSLSMNAIDVEPSRFDAARELVAGRWGGRGSSGTVSVIDVGPRARVMAADWPAGPMIRPLLEGLEASAGQADWAGAAARAAGLAARRGDTRVAVVTDALGWPAATEALAAAGLPGDSLELLSVGSGLANVGIAAVGVQPRGAGPDQWTVTGTVVTTGFARGDVVRVVASYRPPGTTTFLPWGAEDVALESGGRGEFAIPLDLPGPGEVQVRGPEGDHLTADDAAIVSLQPDPVRIAVVGAAHPALLRALASVGELEVYAAQQVPAPREAALFDLVIVTEDSPVVPATSTWWLGAVPAALAAGELGSLEPGSLSAGSHRLAADLGPEDIAVNRATVLEVPAGASEILTAAGEVLAWARTATTGRQVVFGFDLEESNWVSQLSFPAFVAALVEWSAPRTWSGEPGGCRVGEPCDWPREAFAGSWQLLDPAGNVIAGTPRPTAVDDDPLASGVWLGPQLDAGFVPKVAGSFTLRTELGSVPLPVVVTPLRADSAAAAEMAPPPAARPVAMTVALWRWLAGFAGLLLISETLLALRRQQRVVRRRWRTPLLLAALAVVSLGLALVGSPLPGYGPAGTVVWVGQQGPPADLRAAAEGVRWQWVRRGAANASSGDEELSADRLYGLAGALEEALATVKGPGEMRVLLEGGGGDALSVNDAAMLSQAASGAGVVVDVIGLEADEVSVAAAPRQVAISGVALPDRVRAGSRYSLQVEVEAPNQAGWQLAASLVSSSPAPEAETAAVAEVDSGLFPDASATGSAAGAGGQTVEIELQAGSSGNYLYSLELRNDDAVEAATKTIVSVEVGPPPAVLLIASNEDRGVGLQAALEAQGLSVERTTPLRMPGNLEGLGEYDSVVLADVSANHIFPEYQDLLERYVREAGGGLTIVGGTSSFGPGGYYATPLEELSPLSSRITDEAPEVTMAFVLDRSGSMSGAVGDSTRMDLAKAATLEAIGLLGEKSLAALIVFDTEARVVLPPTPVTERSTFTAALSSVTPAGGTSIYPGLVEAFGLMSETPSATRHVVVMTDGLSQEGDFAGVLEAMQLDDISTTFVGVGDAADRRQLTTLAALSGGTLHMALDFRALPSLLAQEALMAAATPIEEGAVTPRWAAGDVPEFLAEVSDVDLPQLGGYVKTTLKEEASVHAYAASDDPLLASWRYGLGRVVAFASDGDGRWSEEWTKSPAYGRVWAQSVRWVSQGPLREPWTLRLGQRGQVLDVVVDLPEAASDAAGADLPLLSLALADGELLGQRRLERLSESRAAASFELEAEFVGQLELSLSPAPELGLPTAGKRQVSWPLPPGPPLRSDMVSPASLVEATGGTVYSSPGEWEPVNDALVLTWQRLPGIWLSLAMVAFILSLALRLGLLPRFFSGPKVRPVTRTRTAWPDR